MKYFTYITKPSVRVFSSRKSIENKVLYLKFDSRYNFSKFNSEKPLELTNFIICNYNNYSFKSLLKETYELVQIFISSRKTATLNLNN